MQEIIAEESMSIDSESSRDESEDERSESGSSSQPYFDLESDDESDEDCQEEEEEEEEEEEDICSSYPSSELIYTASEASTVSIPAVPISNEYRMNIDVIPNQYGFGYPMEQDYASPTEEDDAYIDIDDIDVDDNESDDDIDGIHGLDLNYSSHKQSVQCTMHKMENELLEINKWIKFIHAINKLSAQTRHEINKNICIELVNHSTYELRIKQQHKYNYNENIKIIDNISFVSYPETANFDMDGYSNEELRFAAAGYEKSTQFKELDTLGFFHYLLNNEFDAMDVNINQCLSYYKHKSHKYLRFIRQNMRNNAQNKNKVVYNTQLIQTLIEMLTIAKFDNLKVQTEILYILKYIAHRNCESISRFNKIFIDLITNYTAPKAALYIVAKISHKSSFRDVLLQNDILSALLNIYGYNGEDFPLDVDYETVGQIELILSKICCNFEDKSYFDVKYVPNVLVLCGIIIDPEVCGLSYSETMQKIFAYLTEMNETQKLFEGNILLNETKFIKQHNKPRNILLFDGFIRQTIPNVVVPIDIHQIYLYFGDMFNNKINRCISESLIDLWLEGDDNADQPIIDGLFTNKNDIETILKCVNFLNDNQLYSDKTVINHKIVNRINEFLDWNDDKLGKQASIFVLKNGKYSNEELAYKQQYDADDAMNGRYEAFAFSNYPLLWSWDWNMNDINNDLSKFKWENGADLSQLSSFSDTASDKSGDCGSFTWNLERGKRAVYVSKKRANINNLMRTKVEKANERKEENINEQPTETENEWTSAWKMPSNMFVDENHVTDANNNNKPTNSFKFNWES